MNLAQVCLSIAAAFAVGSGTAFAQQNSTPPALDPWLNNPKHHKYTAEQAKAVALSVVDGKVDTDPVFKFENNYWLYVVSVKTSKEVTRVWVNADTGRIVGFDTHDPKGDSKAVQKLKKQIQKKLKHSKKRKKIRKRPVIIIQP